ncbi:MAG: ThuA domain-containing protein, partial [Planctomycetaceae bacterium]
MQSRRTFWVLLCFSLIFSISPAGFAAEKLRVLMLTDSKGYRHGSVTRPEGQLSPAEIAVTQLGQQTELFTVDCTQETAADFTKKNLQNYDVVIFYTTGELPIAEEDRDYFVNDWLKQKGHGFIGFHSAADTYRADNDEALNEKYKWYWNMLGGTFNGHPWNAGDTVTITVHDPEHPTMQPFGEKFTFRDEIYQYKNWQPEKVRVL